MATIVVPFRPNGKTRLGDAELARAMFEDVLAACEPIGRTVVADAQGGQGDAVAAVLAGVQGPVVIVNADVPCATTAEVEQLLAAAPALVAARDGTTNALALRDARDFVPLYGPGSARRFSDQLGARSIDLPGLRDDVDTPEDVAHVTDRMGPRTRAVLKRTA